MSINIVKTPVKKSEIAQMAREGFGDVGKVVADGSQNFMAIGGELHADEEVMLSEKEGSKREDMWGFNIYPEKAREEWLEFNSMVNIKPHLGNRTRDIGDPEVKEKIRKVVEKLVIE